jgi:hypothetical protein
MTNRDDSFGFGNKLPAHVSRILDAAEAISEDDPNKIGFQHAVFCQVGLPRSRQDSRVFTRSSGNASIQIDAGSLYDGQNFIKQPLPYGTRPRLAMIYLASEAVRTQSKIIDVCNNTHQFLKNLGMDTSGKGYKIFENQMKALSASRMTLGYSLGDKAITIDAKPIHRFEAWLNSTDSQQGMWPGQIELSEQFYDTLSHHAVPLDYRAVGALSHSSMALDIYTWLAHRLHRIDKPINLTWWNLKNQFGQEYADKKNFTRQFKKALRQALAVYPNAKVEDVTGGLLLKNSLPPIRKVVPIRHKG